MTKVSHGLTRINTDKTKSVKGIPDRFPFPALVGFLILSVLIRVYLWRKVF